MLSILYILPKNLLSRLVGWVLSWYLPEPLRVWSLRTFANAYEIDLQEAEKPLTSYACIADFFVRRLRDGARPLASGRTVHPADAQISQIGLINDGQLIQAKGKVYGVEELVGSAQVLAELRGGLFVTYYLCPTDYHRVHSPVSGVIEGVTHIPGQLWPVNDWSVARIPKLFCVNERVVVKINASFGSCYVVFVGATNVGKISLSCLPDLQTNQVSIHKPRQFRLPDPTTVEKGQELGVFHMGSTVILCLPPAIAQTRTSVEWEKFRQGKTKVRAELCP